MESQTPAQANLDRVVRHIAKFRSRPAVRLLDVLYGPSAKYIRMEVAAMLHGIRKVRSSDKTAQFGNIRAALVAAAGAAGDCIAAVDADFEAKAAVILTAQAALVAVPAAAD
jgi:hypothetical protein